MRPAFQKAGRTADTLRLRVQPLRHGDEWGVWVDAGGAGYEQPRPVGFARAPHPERRETVPYASVEEFDDGFSGHTTVQLGTARLEVADVWRVEGSELRVRRNARVSGNSDCGFLTTLTLRRAFDTEWDEIEPFAPGAVYGNCPRVPELAIGSATLRRSGVEHVLAREDRLAAPLFGVRFRDGTWFAVLHRAPDASTVANDCLDVDGAETLVDSRLGFASLGCARRERRVELGAWFPGSEGETTYTSGGLPLRQVRAWRGRFHPVVDGFEQTLEIAFRFGLSEEEVDFQRAAWRWAWDSFAPIAYPVDTDTVVDACAQILAGAAVAADDGRAGIPLELDATTGCRPATGGPAAAIMGFVGANTDAAYVLLRAGRERNDPLGAQWRRLGEKILDSFAAIDLSPPVGEGFDLDSGEMVTYRSHRGRPAVYARSIAEGCLAALDAWEFERRHGTEHDRWLRWAASGGDWLLAAQRQDGSLPRAWEAATGAVLDDSPSSSYVAVAFLVALAGATGQRRYLDGALQAGKAAWRLADKDGCFAGATLDNPDVVDKEAAVLSLEAFLALHDATGDERWLSRAAVAAALAETWIYIWDVPMPVDADSRSLHWKPGLPTAGQQLISTGVSMADGFLAVNAAAFARLGTLTGDQHLLDVAGLVAHGTKTMLGLPGRTFDLAGVGWQQEHWSFAGRRGFGLNRNWLPWVSVAHARGIYRLRDLDPAIARTVLLQGGAPA